MSAATSKSASEPLVVVFDTKVAPGWMEMVQSAELFARSCCGYWARGVKFDGSEGWLVWESADKCRPGIEPNRDAAFAAWRTGAPLPAGWFRLDLAAAVRAWIAGVRRWGEGWFQGGSHGRCDVAMQEALLGEVRYG